MAAPNASFTLHHIFNLMLFLPLISSIFRCFSTGRIYSEPDPCWLACLDRGIWLFSIKSTQKCVLLCSSHVLHRLQGKGPDPGWFWAHKHNSKCSVFLRIKSSAAILAGGVEQFLACNSPSDRIRLDREAFPQKTQGEAKEQMDSPRHVGKEGGDATATSLSGMLSSVRSVVPYQTLPPQQTTKGKWGRTVPSQQGKNLLPPSLSLVSV